MASSIDTLANSIPALITPLTAKHELDSEGQTRLIEHVLQSGSSGMVVLGTTGEFAVNPPSLRAAAITNAVKSVKGRVPVIIGVGRPSLEEMDAEIAQAADLGADAVLCTPSYYFPLNGEQVRRQYNHLVKKAKLPIFYYHIPQMTKVAIGPEVIGQLVQDGAICGIKDSSGMAPFLARVVTLTRHDPAFRPIVGGPFYLMGALAMGAVGVTGSLGSVFPHLEVDIIRAYRAGDAEGAMAAQERLHRFRDVLQAPGTHDIARAKGALESMGICQRHMMPPLSSVDDAAVAAFKKSLKPFLPSKAAAA